MAAFLREFPGTGISVGQSRLDYLVLKSQCDESVPVNFLTYLSMDSEASSKKHT